jgi:hypothetical protein
VVVNFPIYNVQIITLIDDALEVHRKAQFELGIHAILSCIKGIIRDWIYTKLIEGDNPWS